MSMALVTLSDLKQLQNNLNILDDKDGSLYNILKELQGLKINVVAGAGANTNIAVTGIVTTDTLLAVLQFEPDDGTSSTMITNRTGTTSITSAGNIQCTVSTASKQLLVVWYDKS